MSKMQRRFWLVLVMSLGSWTAQAVDFSQKPLFLGSSTQPNIFFMLDNSQSMTWDSLVPEEVANEAKFRKQDNSLATDLEQAYDFTPDNDAEKRRLCYGYNRLAFNPTVTYGIWAGKDKTGADFPNYSNINLNGATNDKKARYNPYLTNTDTLTMERYGGESPETTTSSNFVDISGHYFYPLKSGSSYSSSALTKSDCDLKPVSKQDLIAILDDQSGLQISKNTTGKASPTGSVAVTAGSWSNTPTALPGDYKKNHRRAQNSTSTVHKLTWKFSNVPECIKVPNVSDCKYDIQASWPDSNDDDTSNLVRYSVFWTKANGGPGSDTSITKDQDKGESTVDNYPSWQGFKTITNDVKGGSDLSVEIRTLSGSDYDTSTKVNTTCKTYKQTCVKYETQLVGETPTQVCVDYDDLPHIDANCKDWNKVTTTVPNSNTARLDKYVYADPVRLIRTTTTNSSCSNRVSDWDGDGVNDQTPDGRVCVKYLSKEKQQNYARWYSYNRKREYVMKLAVSQLIDQSTERMGLGVLSLYKTPTADASGEFLPDTNKPLKWQNNRLNNQVTVGLPLADMTNATSRTTLLDDLLRLQSDNLTPLRSRMVAVGEYFDLNSSGKTFANSAMDYRGDPIVKSVLGFDEPTNPADVYLATGGNCQQNFAILLTDGYVNENKYGNIADVIANNDCDSDSAFDYSSQKDANCSQSALDTLGDIAQYYYERDLAPGIANDIRVVGDDENPAQHLLTYTVAFGVDGTIKGMPTDRKTTTGTWPNPADKTQTSVDDVRHAAWNGRGRFLNAQDPQALIQALQDVITLINQRNTVGALSAASATSGQLTASTRAFVQEFSTADWSGRLLAYSLNPTNANLDTLQWDAAAKLKAKVTASGFGSRLIATYNGNSVVANWANLTTAMQNDLNTAPNGTADGNGQKRLDYLKGDQSNEEGGTGLNLFRQRSSLIGTLINSGSLYVQKPASSWPATFSGYSTFVTNNQNREAMVYFGSNNGLLHAVKAADGEEVFAYMPSLLASSGVRTGLHYLTDPSFNHHYYVDGPLSVQDVFTKSRASGSESWRTILTAGLGAGAPGLFALDVTDPNDFTAADVGQLVMWEFGASDSADIGHITGQPIIAPMQNGRWAVITGNGYNSANGIAKLMIIYVDGGIDGSWTLNSDYIVLNTASGSAGDKNGLSAPAVLDITGPSGLPDGKVDLIYAGDIYGDLWKFDVSAASDASWTTSKLFAGSRTQPITAAPATGINPFYKKDKPTMADPNMMVVFGTGQYLGTNDVGNTDAQNLFGVFDNGVNTNVNAGELVEQTITTETTDGYRLASKNPVDFTINKGWKLVLPTAGERVVYTPQVRGDLAYFESIIPSGDGCEVQAGSGFLMAVGLAEGGAPTISSFDRTGDGIIDDNDKIAGEPPVGFMVNGIPGASLFIGDYRITGTSEALPTSTLTPTPAADSPGRLSWQELTNF